MTSRRLMLGLAAACSFTALAGAAFADPPGRVGRVSDVEGAVSFQPSGEDFWAPAQQNLPVASGESFWTDAGGRFELQVGGVEAWVDQDSELDVLDLDYGVTRLALPQGSMDVRVWSAPRGGIAIQTPAGEVRIDRPGVYRIDSQPAGGDGDFGPVAVSVFQQGHAFIPSFDGAVPVDARQVATFLPGYDVDYDYPQETDIDAWARRREAHEAELRREAAWWDEYTGADDLDGAGDWMDHPQYGRVWFPHVDRDWAPYRYGHWSYVRPWGWTWIDDQPWGFTPFHYGRWAQIDGRWGWVAGRPEAEPVYAPALVAFVGGSGWGVSIGVGGDAMGWVPLAPDEPYVPTYQVSGDYVRRLNTAHVPPAVINTIVVNNTVVINRTVVVYRNAPAATVVRAADFARGGSVQKAVVTVPPGAMAKAPPAGSPEKLAPPTREARGGGSFAAAGGGRPGGSGPAFANAPHPPQKVMALHAAVAAQPPGATRPPATLKASAPPAAKPGGKPLQLKPHPVGGFGGQGQPPHGPPNHATPPAPGGNGPEAHKPMKTSTPPPAPPAPPPPSGRHATPPTPVNHAAPPAPPPPPKPVAHATPPAPPPTAKPAAPPKGEHDHKGGDASKKDEAKDQPKL